MGFVVNPIVWVANAFLPLALAQWHAGRLNRGAVFGAVAVACAALPLVWSLGLTLEIGYYVWLSSMVIFPVGSFLCWHLQRRAEPGRQVPRATPV